MECSSQDENSIIIYVIFKPVWLAFFFGTHFEKKFLSLLSNISKWLKHVHSLNSMSEWQNTLTQPTSSEYSAENLTNPGVDTTHTVWDFGSIRGCSWAQTRLWVNGLEYRCLLNIPCISTGQMSVKENHGFMDIVRQLDKECTTLPCLGEAALIITPCEPQIKNIPIWLQQQQKYRLRKHFITSKYMHTFFSD